MVSPRQQGTKGWYQRHENNGWRPITIKALSSAEYDPVTAWTASGWQGGDNPQDSPPTAFHYSRLVREQCRIARKKRRVSHTLLGRCARD